MQQLSKWAIYTFLEEAWNHTQYEVSFIPDIEYGRVWVTYTLLSSYELPPISTS